MKELSKRNTSGVTGVTFKNDKWCAQIWVCGNIKLLGYFATKKEAIVARIKAMNEFFLPTTAKEKEISDQKIMEVMNRKRFNIGLSLTGIAHIMARSEEPRCGTMDILVDIKKGLGIHVNCKVCRAAMLTKGQTGRWKGQMQDWQAIWDDWNDRLANAVSQSNVCTMADTLKAYRLEAGELEQKQLEDMRKARAI